MRSARLSSATPRPCGTACRPGAGQLRGSTSTAFRTSHAGMCWRSWRKRTFDVAAWETTCDIGVPAFFCLIADRRNPQSPSWHRGRRTSGAGVALLRALTEAVQVRTTYISGTRDDLLPEEYTDAERDRKRRKRSPPVVPRRMPPRNFGAIADRSTATFDGVAAGCSSGLTPLASRRWSPSI